MKFNDFDAQMRRFEQSLDERCPVDAYLMLRLDGRGFTRLVKRHGLDRPFDARFHEAMETACERLMNAGLNTVLCYTQSDEISILLDPAEHAFSRQTRKLNSIMAAEASVSFSFAMQVPAVFDCRVCPLPTMADVADYLRWRLADARRNALSGVCYWHLRASGLSGRTADRRLSGYSTRQKERFLRDEGVGLDEPHWAWSGAMLHWEDVEHTGIDPRSGETAETTRRRLKWVAPGNDLAAHINVLTTGRGGNLQKMQTTQGGD